MIENTKQAIPAAWESVLAQMSEELAANEVGAQIRKMRQMTALVEARAAQCYRLKLEHARRAMANKGAKCVSHLRWINRYEEAECVLEATLVYMKILNVLEKPQVQDELTDEEFGRLVDQLTEECLYVIDNPNVWTLK